MRNLVQNLISAFRVPATRWYLKRDRKWKHNGMDIMVRRGVFHPGLFPSTSMLLQFLRGCPLKSKTLLELGCGTGAISIQSGRMGAIVTATDVSQSAIANAREKAKKNDVEIRFIHSDLFENFPIGTFDWIVINPPYYRKTPANESEHAWYCGENFDYFKKLFGSLHPYMTGASVVLMTLAETCDIPAIRSIARNYGYDFQLLVERSSWHEGTDFLFRISRKS